MTDDRHILPLNRALVNSYRLSIVTMQRFGHNLQRKCLEEASVPLLGGGMGGCSGYELVP